MMVFENTGSLDDMLGGSDEGVGSDEYCDSADEHEREAAAVEEPEQEGQQAREEAQALEQQQQQPRKPRAPICEA